MANVQLITGTNGADNRTGTAGDDLIYGFDPNGPQANVSTIAATRLASGLSQPVFAGAPPGDAERLFIVEKTGAIRILDLTTGSLQPAPFADLSSQISAAGEGGLLGLAFDPNFASNGYFYVNLINTAGDTEIRRYHVSATDPDQVDTTSATLVIGIDQPSATNHKAGWLGFGPDGMLYASLGDGGSTPEAAQDINNLRGKILRLDVSHDGFPADPDRFYAIPPDNPFLSSPVADEVYALGLRNPWRPSFDRGLGDLYIADVGEGTWEEINRGAPGANYGWNVYEGPDVHAGGTPSAGDLTFPIYFYDHSVGHSITGGYVYRGNSEGLQGQYFFADFVAGKIFTLRFSGGTATATERTAQIVEDVGTVGSPSSFGEDGLGRLYVTDLGGEVFRLTPQFVSTDLGDTLQGLDGNDTLFGGAGSDVIDGGPGRDTAIYSGNLADYTLARAGVTVTISGAGGTDTLNRVEALRFADALLPVAPPDRDFNGDGRSDILFSRQGAVFGSDYQWQLDHRSLVAQGAVDVYDPSFTVQVIGDFDGDGKSDILFQNPATGGVYEWRLDGRTILSQGAVDVGDPNFSLLGAGDFDGDGRTDLLFRNDAGVVFGWTMNGFTNTPLPVGPLDPSWRVQGTGDFDGDGKDDILLHNSGGATSDDGAYFLWQMNGSVIAGEGGIERPVTAWKTLGIGDFDGDGKADFAVRNESASADNGAVWVYLMNGTTIKEQGAVGVADPAVWNLQEIADFNGDGKADILFRNASGYFYAWDMDGTAIAAEGLLQGGAQRADPAFAVVQDQWQLV